MEPTGTMKTFAAMPPRSRLAASRASLALFAALIVLPSGNAVAQIEDDTADAVVTANGQIEALVNKRIEKIFNERVEEIIVVGNRPAPNANMFRRLYEDPLRKRIREELRQLDVLEEEFAWREETADHSSKPDRIRAGYDPRDALRAGLMPAEFQLPLDLVQPASLIRVDF